MPTPLYITGIGIATALGATSPETYRAILSGQFITSHARVPIPSEPGVSRVTTLARSVALQAIADAGLFDSAPATDCALVIGTSKGAVEDWLSPAALNIAPAKWGLSSIAADLSQSLGLPFSLHCTLAGACASGLHALIHASMLIQSGRVQRALVVATESSLHPLFLGSFAQMGVLADPAVGCRPFDRKREGFLVSEAAAAVVIEQEPNSTSAPYAKIGRCAVSGDGHHLTGADPAGSTLRRIIRQCVANEPVQLIHAHGTGTLTNDPIELAAIAEAMPQGQPPYVYSHKGALGHSLGASGLLAVVVNAQAHRHKQLPPNVRTTDPIAVHGLLLAHNELTQPLKRSLAIAQGFGGAIAGVLLASP